MGLFFIFAPFGSILHHFVFGDGLLVGLFAPFFYRLFCICTGRETSESFFPVFAPLLGPSTGSGRAERRSWSWPGGRPAVVPEREGHPGAAIAKSYRDYGREGLRGMARGKCHGRSPSASGERGEFADHVCGLAGVMRRERPGRPQGLPLH